MPVNMRAMVAKVAGSGYQVSGSLYFISLKTCYLLVDTCYLYSVNPYESAT
jgi:hypothetical protein